MITLTAKIFLFFIVTLLLLCVFLFFGVPVYRFAPASTFQGEAIYNPYRNIDASEWRKANFHAHQREQSHRARINYSTKDFVEAYQKMDYDVIGLSDHQYLNYYGYDRPGFIPTYEHGYGLNRYHLLLIGAQKVSMYDFPLMLTRSQMQYVVEQLVPEAQLLVLNHPGQTRLINHKFYNRLRGYDLLEINPERGSQNSVPCWDTALSAGIYSNLIANDDAHSITNRNSWFQRAFTMINTPDLMPNELINRLKQGATYGVYVPRELNTREKPHQGLPTVEDVGLRGEQVYVRVSEPAQIRFIGQGGKLLKELPSDTSATYDFAKTDTYVRMEAHFPNGAILFMNPFVRTQYTAATAGIAISGGQPQQPVNTFVRVVNYPMTILTHILWLFVSIVLVSILLRILGVWKRWRSLSWMCPRWVEVRLFPEI